MEWLMNDAAQTQAIQTACCIAGGGPAGMMLGFLLARSGVPVVVLEKHADFLRDFRGDTIHPSTLEVMHELGLLEEFLKRPHQELREIGAQVGETRVTVADLSHLPTRCKFVALMPQWDFLNFLAEHGRRYPGFQLLMEAEVTDILEANGQVTGLKVKTRSGELKIFADLTVGADGRHSLVRERAGLEIISLGAPMDVLWMRVSRKPGDPQQILGRVDAGHILVMLDRGDYWQCGFVIPKGTFSARDPASLASLRREIAQLAPFLADRMDEMHDWNDVKLLTVAVDRLRRWYRPGLICIGDAAHAMSPIGGVGINLAIQDAVATANMLAPVFRNGRVGSERLQKVQQRRELPAKITQTVQIFIQNRIIRRVFEKPTAIGKRLPLVLRLLQRWPTLRRIPARVIGIGFRPEHVTIPDSPSVPMQSGKPGLANGSATGLVRGR